MITKLNIISVVVKDMDEALQFYAEKLGFEKRTDQEFGPGMRWLTVAPGDQKEIEIVFVLPNKAVHGAERARDLTAQIGKAPTWSFSVDDCQKTYETLSAKGVKFESLPTKQFYGIEAVCQDLYGNTFSLVERI
ncbi:MAG: VOC family protein [Ktedonobacteraceae bacterium]